MKCSFVWRIWKLEFVTKTNTSRITIMTTNITDTRTSIRPHAHTPARITRARSTLSSVVHNLEKATKDKRAKVAIHTLD